MSVRDLFRPARAATVPQALLLLTSRPWYDAARALLLGLHAALPSDAPLRPVHARLLYTLLNGGDGARHHGGHLHVLHSLLSNGESGGGAPIAPLLRLPAAPENGGGVDAACEGAGATPRGAAVEGGAAVPHAEYWPHLLCCGPTEKAAGDATAEPVVGDEDVQLPFRSSCTLPDAECGARVAVCGPTLVSPLHSSAAARGTAIPLPAAAADETAEEPAGVPRNIATAAATAAGETPAQGAGAAQPGDTPTARATC